MTEKTVFLFLGRARRCEDTAHSDARDANTRPDKTDSVTLDARASAVVQTDG